MGFLGGTNWTSYSKVEGARQKLEGGPFEWERGTLWGEKGGGGNIPERTRIKFKHSLRQEAQCYLSDPGEKIEI